MTDIFQNYFNCLRTDAEIPGIMICSNCRQFAISPIEMCSTEHVYCALCVGEFRIKGCEIPTCKKPFVQLSVSSNLAQSYEQYLRCRNSNEGCSQWILSTQMLNHLTKTCKYRRFSQIGCLLKGQNSCPGLPYKMPHELLNHLTDVHHIDTVRCGTLDNVGRFSVQNYLQRWEDAEDMSVSARLYDGHIFLRHRIYKDYQDGNPGCLRQWVSILGDEKDAEKYRVTLTIRGRGIPIASSMDDAGVLTVLSRYNGVLNVPPDQLGDLSWDLSIVPGYKYDLMKIFGDHRSFVAEVTSTDLKPRCSNARNPSNSNTYRYAWTDEFEIIKVHLPAPSFRFKCFLTGLVLVFGILIVGIIVYFTLVHHLVK